jgi:Ala-tRNA(Pro) deacylase
MPVTTLRKFLDGHNIKYVIITHSTAYTAQGVAASAHVSGKELAKTVMVKIDGKMSMAVLPAPKKADLNVLKKAMGAQSLELANEGEFQDLFPDCELGAMPPFGNLYDIPVYVSEALTKDKEIAFNAGTHRELVKLAYQDYEKLVKPRVLKF